MLKKSLLYAIPICTAIGPAAYYAASERISSKIGQQAALSIPGTAERPAAQPPAAISPGASAAVDSGVEVGLEEALRFDLTPAWVVSRFPRVSAGLGYLQLQGYRVALVSGTAEDDVAGSLTYYFNLEKLQRIVFQGTTGDYRRLSQFLMVHYGFALRPVNTPGVFLFEGPAVAGKAGSFLWVEPSSLMKAEEPFKRFNISLVLDRPEGN